MKWVNTLRDNLKLRPFWMNALMFFCAYMAVIYVPWDFFSRQWLKMKRCGSAYC